MSMAGFVNGRYEDYITLYPNKSDRPIDGQLYYLEDDDGHHHIILNGEEYAVSATAYNPDGTKQDILSIPIEFHSKAEYVDDPTIVDKQNTAVFIYENTVVGQ